MYGKPTESPVRELWVSALLHTAITHMYVWHEHTAVDLHHKLSELLSLLALDESDQEPWLYILPISPQWWQGIIKLESGRGVASVQV